MTRSRLIFAAGIACGCLLNWAAGSSVADETPLRQRPFDLLLQSGPGGRLGLAFEATPPDAELMRTNFLVPKYPGAAEVAPESLRGYLAQEAENFEAELAVDETADVEGRPGEATDDDGSDSGQESSQDPSNRARLESLRKAITDVKIEATEKGQRVPENIAAMYLPQSPRVLITSVASSPPLPDRYPIEFKHRPLFYEQRNLERCGESFGYLQNAVSGAQFLANTMVLPYRMCSQRAACPVPAGGDCKTCQSYPVDCDPFPVNPRGLVSEAAAIAGFTFLLL